MLRQGPQALRCVGVALHGDGRDSCVFAYDDRGCGCDGYHVVADRVPSYTGGDNTVAKALLAAKGQVADVSVQSVRKG